MFLAIAKVHSIFRCHEGSGIVFKYYGDAIKIVNSSIFTVVDMFDLGNNTAGYIGAAIVGSAESLFTL